MKKIVLLLLVLHICLPLCAQNTNATTGENEYQALSVGVGFAHGGGLIGAEYERLLFDQFAVTAGAGLFGFNGGLNYHFAKTVDSSFVHIGAASIFPGDGYYQLEGSFNGRAFGWLEATIGYAYFLSVDDSFREEYESNYDESLPNGMLAFALAWYTTF